MTQRFDDIKKAVYLLHCVGTKRYKIGMTQESLRERWEYCQRFNQAFEIELMHYIEVDSPGLVESCLHQRFYPQKKRGEYFDFDNIQFVIEEMNIYAKTNKSLEEKLLEKEREISALKAQIYQLKRDLTFEDNAKLYSWM